MLDSLFRYAKFQYECGNYSAASLCLYYYRNLVPQQNPNYLNVLYGKLASEILLQVIVFLDIKNIVEIKSIIITNIIFIIFYFIFIRSGHMQKMIWLDFAHTLISIHLIRK